MGTRIELREAFRHHLRLRVGRALITLEGLGPKPHAPEAVPHDAFNQWATRMPLHVEWTGWTLPLEQLLSRDLAPSSRTREQHIALMVHRKVVGLRPQQ